MNPESESHESTPAEEPSETPETPGTGETAADDPSSTKEFTESIEDALKRGAKDAKKTFDEVYPRAKEEFAKGIHDVAYAFAYATAFGGALLREVTPDNLRDGFREGSAAGQRAAEDVIRERRERAERHEASAATDDETPEGAPA